MDEGGGGNARGCHGDAGPGHPAGGRPLGRPVHSVQLRPGPGAPVSHAVFLVHCPSGRPAKGASGSGVRKVLEANPFYDRCCKKIQQLRRSDPAAFESWLEKRSEFSMQPVGHSKQGDFYHMCGTEDTGETACEPRIH